MSHTVCTLFEGNYHFGVGALINSLHASGFTGRIVCGHRGPEPIWANAARKISNGIEVIFLPVKAEIHFTHFKPFFMRDCLRVHAPDTTQLYYFDPDVVVKAPWHVFARWAADGVAVCEDVNNYMPARHPYRLAWSDFMAQRQVPTVRGLDYYYNAGFLGLPRAYAELLDVWAKLIHFAEEEIGSLSTIKVDRPNALLHTPDQDALNMSLMVTNVPINSVGPEGMDFKVGGHLMSHAIGTRKPWRGGFFRDALRGKPPGNAQKAFFRFAESPLRLFPASQLARLRLSLTWGALLGRVYRRA